MVFGEETPGRSAKRLPSVPGDGNWRTIAGAVSPVCVADIVDSAVLLTIAGAAPPAGVAKVVAADAAFGRCWNTVSCRDTVPGRPCWDVVPA